MMTLAVILAHVGFDVILGWILLSFRKNDRSWAETLLVSVLLGMYVETLLTGSFLFLGVTLVHAALATMLITAGLTITAFAQGKLKITRPSIDRPTWYEWVALGAVAEQILFAVWQLARTPVYFDDALTQWSGRARALYGGVNWSFDSTSPFFMGGDIFSSRVNSSYPLHLVIWRALTAGLNGAWNDVIARADGLLFFIVIIGTIWVAVARFSKVRWLAASAVFIVSSVPLHAWHAAAGYSDIAVEAFVVVGLAAILRKEWLVGGLMAAGVAWCKDEGIFIYFPTLLAAVVFLQFQEKSRRFEWRCVAQFILGFGTIAPWLIFNYIHRLGVTAGQGRIGWHSDAPILLWRALMTNPTSSILWIGVFAVLLYTSVALLRHSIGRALIAAFVVGLGAISFAFSSTNAYEFLSNGESIHRVLLQFSSVAVLVVTYGLWLKMPTLVAMKSSAPLPASKSRKKGKR